MNDQPVIEFYGIQEDPDRIETLARIRKEMIRFGARPCHDGDRDCLALRMGFSKFFLFEDSVRWFSDTGYTEAWLPTVMIAAWLRFRAQGRLDRKTDRVRRQFLRVLTEEINRMDRARRLAQPDPSTAREKFSRALDSER